MNSYEAYTLYLAIKLHFTSDSYDFYRHNAKVNSSFNTFLKRNDRFFFHKLTTKYNKEEMLDYFVSNFFHNSKTWIGNLVRADGETVYNKWKKYNQSLSYNFRNDCVLVNDVIDSNRLRFDDMFNVDKGQHPRMLRLLLSGKIAVQSLIIFDNILSFINRWDKEIKETIIWPEKSFKITKLKPFVKYNLTKCKFTMKEVFV
mgnify:FL=1|tara:strand:+ start:858 stop:1460 length:603 start_codon:yes stop_codon:yes gene_type:complete